jgi:hypothetical protein
MAFNTVPRRFENGLLRDTNSGTCPSISLNIFRTSESVQQPKIGHGPHQFGLVIIVLEISVKGFDGNTSFLFIIIPDFSGSFTC